MRVYVVRHEKRDRGDATFLSLLLPEGHADAQGRLIDVIERIDPTHIYTSPFLRVLQTVKPYVEARHRDGQAPLLLNVDYRCDLIPEDLHVQRVPIPKLPLPNIGYCSIGT